MRCRSCWARMRAYRNSPFLASIADLTSSLSDFIIERDCLGDAYVRNGARCTPASKLLGLSHLRKASRCAGHSSASIE